MIYLLLDLGKANSKEAESLVVIAVGPHLDLFDYSSSDYEIHRISELINFMRYRQPNLKFELIPYFTLDSLRQVYQLESQRPKPRTIALILYAHGEHRDGELKILSGVNWESSTSIGAMSAQVPTETFLVNCHSGTAHLESFSRGVFGMCPMEDLSPTGFLTMIHKALKANPDIRFPLTAREMYQFVKRYPLLGQIPHGGVQLN